MLFPKCTGHYCPFNDESWDYLIILDACRYDFFHKLHKYFFIKGILKKAWSSASNTYEFVTKCISIIRRPENIIYVSANPYINSFKSIGKRYPWNVLKRLKIVDAWLSLWDERLGTVPPNKLTRLAKKVISENPDKKVVVHYIQPHAPYIHPRFIELGGYANPLKAPLAGSKELETKGTLDLELKLLRYLGLLYKISNGRWGLAYIRLRRKLSLPPINPVDKFIREYGIEMLPVAYAYNLLIVLAYVALLVDYIKKLNPKAKVVITADHGECLGERGVLEHPSVNMPCTREIPVFIPEKINTGLAFRYSLSWKTRIFAKIQSRNVKHNKYNSGI